MQFLTARRNGCRGCGSTSRALELGSRGGRRAWTQGLHKTPKHIKAFFSRGIPRHIKDCLSRGVFPPLHPASSLLPSMLVDIADWDLRVGGSNPGSQCPGWCEAAREDTRSVKSSGHWGAMYTVHPCPLHPVCWLSSWQRQRLNRGLECLPHTHFSGHIITGSATIVSMLPRVRGQAQWRCRAAAAAVKVLHSIIHLCGVSLSSACALLESGWCWEQALYTCAIYLFHFHMLLFVALTILLSCHPVVEIIVTNISPNFYQQLRKRWKDDSSYTWMSSGTSGQSIRVLVSQLMWHVTLP